MQNNLCFTCIHYVGELRCLAFPAGIPRDILIAEKGHTKPHKDQKNDIVYERSEVKEEQP